MPSFKICPQVFRSSEPRGARERASLGVVALALLVNACGAGADGAQQASQDLNMPESRSANEALVYTTEELQALAETPAVKELNSPFMNAPGPNRAVHVTMRDGVKLAVNLYFPPGLPSSGKRAPTVYDETWYTRGVEATDMPIQIYLDAGFVVAIAEPRGFGASFGSQTAMLTPEARADQKDMIAWLSSRPWSNGKVAAVGHSISATQAEAMASSGAPALRAAIIRASDFDHYAGNVFPGGIPNPRMLHLVNEVLEWQRGEACVQDLANCAFIQIAPVDADTDFQLLRAAMQEHQPNVRGNVLVNVTYRDDPIGTGTIETLSPDGSVDALRRARVPARVSASWLDGATAKSALDRYEALPDVPMEVVIGATAHSGGVDADPFREQAFLGAQPSATAQVTADAAFVRRVLAGERIGRSVSYYVLGANRWQRTAQFPPPGVKRHTLRLSGSHLMEGVPRSAGERLYAVDPTTSTGSFNRWGSQGGVPVYYGDRRSAAGERLSFDAAPVVSDTELVGAAELCLAFRSDQPDGTVFAYLEDVAPDGRVTYLTEGMLRLIHRKTRTGGCDAAEGTERSFLRADGEAVQPGQLMYVELPLLPTAALIRRGHRVRLSLTGADADTFPLIGTDAKWSVAYGGSMGSRLTLPFKPWFSG